MSSTRFASVVLDVDSTLSGLEGIDWIAHRRGPVVAEEVSRLTDRAMAGEIALDDVYGHRLDLVRPTRADIDALASAYVQTTAAGAAPAIRKMRAAGVAIVLVSGGIREAILPLASSLDIYAVHVHAVSITFDERGDYADYDRESPLATQHGKRDIVSRLALPRRALAVGDGATDAAIRPVVDAFAAYVGFVHRSEVVTAADMVFHSFDEIASAVLS